VTSRWSWQELRGVLLRSLRGFKRDNCLDLAAALTYWGLLALFPSAVVVVALVGLVATNQAAVQALAEIAEELLPAAAAAGMRARIEEVVGDRAATRVLLSFGVLAAVWVASAYLRSFTRAANAVHGVVESRRAYRLIPQQLGLTLVGLVLAATAVVGLVVSGPVARAVGRALGIGPGALAVWQVAKWPVLVLVATVMLSLLYWVAPDVPQPRFRWLTAGSAAALLGWVVVSAGFGVYVVNFATYDLTYGTLGAVIVFLVWLYLANCAILFGLEIDVELGRSRRDQVDLSASPAPPAPPRAT
jgi:membrane protein